MKKLTLPVKVRLVPVGDRMDAPVGLPRLHRTMPPGTSYALDKGTGQLRHMVTVTPKGLHVGWDLCAMCCLHVRVCRCSSGVVPPNSIWHIFVEDGGERPKEEKGEWKPLPPRLALRVPVVILKPMNPGKRKRKYRSLIHVPKMLRRKPRG